MPLRSLITRVALSVGHFIRPSKRAIMRGLSGEPERKLGALLRGFVDRHLDRDDGAVLPEALERVVHPVLLVEDVDDEVAEVEEHPTPLGSALTAQRLDACFVQLVLDL